MKLSIRTKLTGLLVAVALLPLLAAMVTVAVAGRRLRYESLSQSIEAMARSEARVLRVSLAKDIEKLQLVLMRGDIVARLSGQLRRMDPAEINELDQAWPDLALDDRRLSKVLNNPAAVEFRRIQQQDPRFAEVLITDRHGQLVASSGRTGDFYQADEAWWQGVENAGNWRVFIPPVNYDRSGGVWSVDICIPIVSDGRLVGVGKAVLDVSRLLREPNAIGGGMRAAVMLVRRDGTIVYRHRTIPLTTKADEWTGPIAAGDRPGVRMSADGQIQGFAPVILTAGDGLGDIAAPQWLLVLSLPASETIGAMTEFTSKVLLTGLAVIVMIFLASLLVIDRLLIRRIYRMETAARRIAAGDLSCRVSPGFGGRRLIGGDEIDQLAEVFNDMAGRIQASHESMAATDRMRRDFIRIAGHELRTPVSYLLGTAKLLTDSKDPDRLGQAVRAMGERAARLDEIIRAMFKLMAEGGDSQKLAYSEVVLSDMLDAVCRDCQPFLDKRDLSLIVEGADRIKSIQADAAKLRDIMENLIINAIKFTPDGGVIKVRISRQLGEHVSLAVQDQGPGISEGDLPHIFEPLYSGGDVFKHSSGQVGYAKRGMGLGLAIVKSFVELHGGSVGVSSSPHGCIFTVTLPIARPGS